MSLLHSSLPLKILCFLDLLTQGLAHLRQALHYCPVLQTHLFVCCCFCIQEKHFLARETMFAPVFLNSVHKFSYFLGCVRPIVFICSLKKKSHIRVTREAIFNTNMQQLGDPSGTNMNLLESQGLSQAFVLSRQCHCLNTFSFMSPLSSQTEPPDTGLCSASPCMVPAWFLMGRH